MRHPTSCTELEAALGALLVAGRYDEATTLAIRRYGPELLAFLHSRLNDLDAAREAFSWLAEDVWRGIPGFQRRSTVRTWVYAIARNAAHRYADRELRARGPLIPISQVSRASALAVQLPSTRGDDDRVARLRAQLDEEEQTLLTMRLEKQLSWREVALVFLYGDNPAPDESVVEREAARLRKRFQLLKGRLRTLA